MTKLNKHLFEITKSAHAGDWTNASHSLALALSSIDIDDAMRIMIAFMRTHLVNIPQHHPELSWALDWLDALEKLKPIDFGEHQFGFWTNCSNTKRSTLSFLECLAWSNGAYSWYIGRPHSSKRYLSMCTSAISPAIGCTIVARLEIYTEENHPEIYNEYMQAFNSPKEILFEKWTQAEQADYRNLVTRYNQIRYKKHVSLWLEVVELFRVIPKSYD